MVKGEGGATLVALTLALAGCGDDSDPETVTVTTPAETPAQPEDEGPTEAADERRGSAALLTLDDFPSGWTATEDESESQESACPAIRDARAAVNARAVSPEFGEDDRVGAQHTVYLYAAEDEAKSHFADMTSSSGRECFGDDLADRISEGAEGVEIQEPTTSELRVEPVGSESAAVRVTVPYTSEVIDDELVLDAVFVRVGRGLSLFAIYSDFGSPDDEQRDQLVGIATRRLNQELD